MKHNQRENFYNTAIRSFITFGGHSKVRDILSLPLLGGLHHTFMHLLYTVRKRCFERLFYRRFTKPLHEIATCILADWVLLLHEKHLEMTNKCFQLLGSEKEDLFQDLDWKLQQLVTKVLSLHHLFHILCSYNKCYFRPKCLFALSKIAKKQPKSFFDVFCSKILSPKFFGFNVVK